REITPLLPVRCPPSAVHRSFVVFFYCGPLRPLLLLTGRSADRGVLVIESLTRTVSGFAVSTRNTDPGASFISLPLVSRTPARAPPPSTAPTAIAAPARPPAAAPPKTAGLPPMLAIPPP